MEQLQSQLGDISGEGPAPPAHQELATLADGDRVESCYAVRDRSRRPTKRGGEWLALKLADRTATVSAKSWDEVEARFAIAEPGTVVRIVGRNMAKGETMRLYYSPDQPQLGKSVALKANVMEPSGEPLSKGEVAARIVAPSGRAQTIQFTSLGDEWGAFMGQYVSEEPGRHQVTLSCRKPVPRSTPRFSSKAPPRNRSAGPPGPRCSKKLPA